MSLVLLFLLVLWTVTVGTTLLVARNRIGRAGASLGNELLARGVALVSASVALGALGLAGSLFTASTDVLRLVPFLWLAAAAPLVVPPLAWRGALRVSSMGLILTSVMLSAAGAPVLALYVLARLIMTNPEII